MGTLVLVRHGQSQWNLENRFAGWTDVPLTERGRRDAANIAEVLREFHFDIAFTSKLQRASETLTILLRELHQNDVPVQADEALNERHYGTLQGLNKAETAKKYGQEQVQLWRRSYASAPPAGESIADCCARVLPYFERAILPLVEAGKTVLIVAHGNSMRPIIQVLDHLDNDTTATMEVGLCIPSIYVFEGKKLVKKEVREVPGVVTKGASTTENRVEKGRIGS